MTRGGSHTHRRTRSAKGKSDPQDKGDDQPDEAPPSDPQSSEPNEGRASRSSRLKNPEFAAKHKAFMAKVTAATKGSMDTYLTNEIISETTPSPSGKKKLPFKDIQVKRTRASRSSSVGAESRSDNYCWICHKEGEFMCCETCPRVFHARCLQLESSPEEDWVCPECVLTLSAENMNSRSRAMRLLTIDQLCTLLKHAMNRMKSVSNVEPFLKPVDTNQFPTYKDYVSHPMDLMTIERNIRKRRYGSTEAMLADCKWIHHNCVVFNSTSSKLTNIAKNIVNVCKHEMQEIENCPDCYLNAHVKKDVWFVEACRLPHPLVWAKLKGFPYWPGKLMRLNSDNHGDVRFFGAHDRAWIPLRDIFLYSEKPPMEIKKKRGNIEGAFEEVEKHRNKLQEKFGNIQYAEHKTVYEPQKELDMIKTLLPSYEPPFDMEAAGCRYLGLSGPESEKSNELSPTLSSENQGIPEESVTSDVLKEPPKPNVVEEGPKMLPIKVKINTKLATVLTGHESDLKQEEQASASCDDPPALEEPAQSTQLNVPEETENMEEPMDAEQSETSVTIESSQTSVTDPEAITSPEKDSHDTKTSDYIETEKKGANQDEPVTEENADDNQIGISTQKCAEEENTTIESTEETLDNEENKDIAEESTDMTGIQNTEETSQTGTNKETEEETSTSRVTTSPPCEVTSTTVSHAVVKDDKSSSEAESEGFIVDSNDERIIIEGESEGSQSDKENLVEKTSTDAQRHVTQSPSPKGRSENPLDNLGPGVSFTVIKKPNVKEKEKDDIEMANGKRKTQNKRAAPDTDSDDERKDKKSKMTNSSDTSSSESTVSQGKKVNPNCQKDNNRPVASESSTQQASKPNNMVSGAKSSMSQSCFPPLLPRFPGLRPGINHMGHMMPMPGPSGMLVRAPPPVPYRDPGFMQNRHHHAQNKFVPGLPSAAGPVADQLNKVANKLADTLKRHFVESLSDTADNLDENPHSVIKRMKSEIEVKEWKHKQELAEIKHNAELVIREMRQTMEIDKQKALMDCKKQAEIEKQAAIKEMKKKQWCAYCGKEAIFYCCWNTSYCDYPCQQAHWPTHMNTCAQNSSRSEEEAILPDQNIVPQHYMPHRPNIAADRSSHHSMMRFMRPTAGRYGPGPAFARPYFL